MAIHMKMILLSLVMLLIAFEPAFSGKILKKLDKELKKMGLQKLQNFLAEIGTNADEIDSNKVHIDNNAVNIGDVENDVIDVANDVVSQGSRLLDLETMGSGSVWFDAWRESNFEASSLTTITYTNVRESNSGAMDIGTGVFTAPLAGTYQFILQVDKPTGVVGVVFINFDGTLISTIADNNSSNGATSTGTAIIEMQPGQKVWTETISKLFSNYGAQVHFTGVLITPK